MTNKLRKVITGDEQFESFRRKLADAVTFAINVNYISIGKGPDDYCPIGAAIGGFVYNPTGAEARHRLEWLKPLPSYAPSAFMDGFDGIPDGMSLYRELQPYYELGQLYRERFV